MAKITDTAPTTPEAAAKRAKKLMQEGKIGVIVKHLPDGTASVEIDDGK